MLFFAELPEGPEGIWPSLGLCKKALRPSSSQEASPTATFELPYCSWPRPCATSRYLGFRIRRGWLIPLLLTLTMWVLVGKGILVLLEELIDFHLQLTQTRLPSARGQGGHILVLSSSGAQWNRIFSNLNDFLDLILSLWHMFLVNQLLLKEARKEREKKNGLFLPKTLSPRATRCRLSWRYCGLHFRSPQ